VKTSQDIKTHIHTLISQTKHVISKPRPSHVMSDLTLGSCFKFESEMIVCKIFVRNFAKKAK